jgi:dihydrolipoamide dehydrogenase
MKSFDVVVIGGGPGGYIAAIRAAQLGLATACIDEEGRRRQAGARRHLHQRRLHPLQGAAAVLGELRAGRHHFADHGVKVKGLELDLKRMLGRKDKVVKQNNDGITYLFKKNKVTFFHGRGAFKSPTRLRSDRET